jgi:1-acyl-sn-glycerol-3-phosphate acyltransferase
MKDFSYKPAGDHGLPPADRLKSLRREGGLSEYLIQGVWRVVVRMFLKLYHRLEVTGFENVPKHAPFVLIANHSSHLDAMVLASVLPWRLRQDAFPIAAGDVFFETPVVSLFSAMMLNALPMWRKKCGPHALKVLRDRLLGDPAIYILFPEGTRSRDGTMAPFRPGLGMLVAGTNAPVVPAYLEGAFDAWRPKTKVPLPKKLRLRIGAPLTFENTPNEREGWELVATETRAAVEGLRTGLPDS